MKILITENQFKLLSELQGKFKEETEIIYKDKNLVCLIPKSQMTSKMLGKKTNWCQTDSGFNIWSHYGLLIRFLLKGGRKIRFTYFFNKDNDYARGYDFYWANETGYHVLYGDGNPFNVRPPKDKMRDIEKDILYQIKLIPEECKKKVLEFIENHKNCYGYIYRDEIFKTKVEIEDEKKFLEVFSYRDKIYETLYNLRKEYQFNMSFYYDSKSKEYKLGYGFEHFDYSETFFDFDSLKERIIYLLEKVKKDGKLDISTDI